MALDLSALDDSLLVAPAATAAPSPTAPKAPLSRFEEDPDQPRFEFDDPEFEDFVEDVRAHGILQPVIVRPVDGTDRLRLRFGARRYRAAVRLQLAELPYFITEDERQFDDYAQVSENEQRKNLQPLELARFIAKKLAHGEKKKAVAAKLRIDPSAVTHLLSLVEAPAFLLELYHSRKCRAPHYLYELRKMHDKNAEIVERRCAEADEIDRRLLVAIAEEIEPPAKAPAEPPVTVKDALDAPGVGGGGGSGAGNDGAAGAAPGATEGDDVQVLQLPGHNPDIEKQPGGKPSDPNKLKKPLLLGTYKGREVMIVLTQRPTKAGLVFIRFEDDGGSEEEVAIGDVALTMLSESHAA